MTDRFGVKTLCHPSVEGRHNEIMSINFPKIEYILKYIPSATLILLRRIKSLNMLFALFMYIPIYFHLLVLGLLFIWFFTWHTYILNIYLVVCQCIAELHGRVLFVTEFCGLSVWCVYGSEWSQFIMIIIIFSSYMFNTLRARNMFY